MTAKELAEECHTYYFGFPETNSDKGIYHFTFNEFQQFCDQLCREQKRIDKIAVDGVSGYDGSTVNLKAAFEAIDDAPMPEV